MASSSTNVCSCRTLYSRSHIVNGIENDIGLSWQTSVASSARTRPTGRLHALSLCFFLGEILDGLLKLIQFRAPHLPCCSLKQGLPMPTASNRCSDRDFTCFTGGPHAVPNKNSYAAMTFWKTLELSASQGRAHELTPSSLLTSASMRQHMDRSLGSDVTFCWPSLLADQSGAKKDPDTHGTFHMLESSCRNRPTGMCKHLQQNRRIAEDVLTSKACEGQSYPG